MTVSMPTQQLFFMLPGKWLFFPHNGHIYVAPAFFNLSPILCVPFQFVCVCNTSEVVRSVLVSVGIYKYMCVCVPRNFCNLANSGLVYPKL